METFAERSRKTELLYFCIPYPLTSEYRIQFTINAGDIYYKRARYLRESLATSGPQIRGGDDEYIPDGAIYFEDQQVPLHYQNKYGTKKGYYCDQFWKDKKELIIKCFEGIKNESNPLAWAVNQASGFVGGELHMTYSKNANVMNPWMTQYVLKHKEDKMGIITCDFAGYDAEFDDYRCNGKGLPKAVVETNRFR